MKTVLSLLAAAFLLFAPSAQADLTDRCVRLGNIVLSVGHLRDHGVPYAAYVGSLHQHYMNNAITLEEARELLEVVNMVYDPRLASISPERIADATIKVCLTGVM